MAEIEWGESLTASWKLLQRGGFYDLPMIEKFYRKFHTALSASGNQECLISSTHGCEPSCHQVCCNWDLQNHQTTSWTLFTPSPPIWLSGLLKHCRSRNMNIRKPATRFPICTFVNTATILWNKNPILCSALSFGATKRVAKTIADASLMWPSYSLFCFVFIFAVQVLMIYFFL